jgi:predicted SAM-dependent methyltransferase
MRALIGLLRVSYHKISSLPDRLRPSNSRLIRQHVSSDGPKKLHLGSGPHLLPGWLNTDSMSSDAIAYLDFTREFPFENDTFDYVFNEHAIEHIPYEQGIGMLREAFRVLRPGGRIRVVTPDFAFLKALHSPEKSALQKAYIKWAIEQSFGGSAPPYAEMHLINNFFRNWGHQFIYDQPSLTGALETAGFTGFKRYEVGESDDPACRGLENETRMPAGFLRLESMVLEAVKAAR